MVFSSATVFAAREFLDDANTRGPGNGSAPSINKHDFPRTFSHEFIGGMTAQQAGNFMFLDAHGTQFGKMQQAQQNFSSDTMLIRHISGRAYQQYSAAYCDISGGPAFETTTPSSQGGPSSAGCGIYAGHWLYEPGTTLRQSVNSSATVLPVQDASRFTNGNYVVIYNAPAGSFNNAEHAKITAVNAGARTITVQRGYKSNKSSHNSGSIVAQHVIGQGTEKRLWAFNMSTQSPTDASGKRFWQFYADWMGKNYNRHNSGAVTGGNIAGIVLDADFYIDLISKNADHNNDLNADHGISGSGVNWLGDGLDAFYQRVRNQLPNRYVMAGVHDARGFHSAQGAQMENWLDYGNGDYSPKPAYKKFDELFQTYLFNMAERDQGPALVHNLTKTPTRLYPGNSSPKPTSNAPFRLGLAMTLMEDGYFGTHTAMTPNAWWDEYAVNLNNGQAVNKNDFAGIQQHRGWLGKPLGKFRRIYNDADFAPASSVLNNGSFDSNTNGWSTSNVNISRDTSNTQDGPGALRVSRMNNYNKNITGAQVRSQSIQTTNGTWTLAFSARADEHREIRIDFGGAIDKVPVGKRWRRYVLELKTNGSNSTLRFNLGRENTQVWFDSIYLFKNKSAHVFMREFENGMALANATSSSKTIQVGSGWKRIRGNQDPNINNGNSVSSVTIGPMDGLLLIRNGATAPPPSGGGGGGGGGSGGASLGDIVWQDTDGDGIQDGNESGYSGVSVSLRQCSGGGTIASTVTAGDGSYSFSGLAAGGYIVSFARPNGATSSPYRAGGDWGIDSDANENTGETLCVTLNADQTKNGVDAGFIPPVGGGGGGGGSGGSTLGDMVWRDTDGDGIQDGNESGYANVNVALKQCNGNTLQTTTTNSSGAYAFNNLAAGNYKVDFERPTGAESSPLRAGNDWGVDSDADEATGETLCISMDGSQTRGGVDAGFIPPAGGGGGSGTASIGDRVWRDTDGDGIQDGGESGYAGVTVLLESCSGNTLASTVTDANGNYLFSNLAAGNYEVEFESPTGATGSPFRAGNDWGADSDANAATGVTLCMSLNAGEDKAGVDAGFIPPSGGGGGGASIGDRIWRDSDGDGIQDGNENGYAGVSVALESCNGNVLATTTSDANGNYSFGGLSAGNYIVDFDAPSGASASPFRAGNDWGVDSDANEGSGETLCISLANNEDKAGVDAGFVPPTGGGGGGGGASIGDRVWRDVNGNGIQNANESGWAGVSVSLMSCSGNVQATTSTDSNGNYLFSGLAAGSYRVGFDAPNGASGSPFRAGNDWGADSDADANTGESLCTDLNAGQAKNGVDAGFIPQSAPSSGANIGDYVWWDEDGDGIQDGSEGGVVGVEVNLRTCGGGVIDSTTTNASGFYQFDNLAAGDYRVEVIAPGGATFSPTRRGPDYTRDSNAENNGITTCIAVQEDSSRPHTDIGLIF
jgi:hypothetical protein